MHDTDGRSNDLEGGWVLQGTGPTPIRVVLGDTELARADIGVVVGRHPALCERTIDDRTISRRHCRFSIREGRLFVEDMNSLNGTLVDGRDIPPFRPVPVDDGQILALGRSAMRVRRVAASERR